MIIYIYICAHSISLISFKSFNIQEKHGRIIELAPMHGPFEVTKHDETFTRGRWPCAHLHPFHLGPTWCFYTLSAARLRSPNWSQCANANAKANAGWGYRWSEVVRSRHPIFLGVVASKSAELLTKTKRRHSLPHPPPPGWRESGSPLRNALSLAPQPWDHRAFSLIIHGCPIESSHVVIGMN